MSIGVQYWVQLTFNAVSPGGKDEAETQFHGALRPVRDASTGLQPRGREMKHKAVVSLLPLLYGLMVFPMEGHATESADPRPAVLVEWESGESTKRISRSSHKTDFFPARQSFHQPGQQDFLWPGLVGDCPERVEVGQERGTAAGPTIHRGRRDGLAPARRRPSSAVIFPCRPSVALFDPPGPRDWTTYFFRPEG